MDSKFSSKEKKNFLFKKHLKDHLFEYILDFIGPMLLTFIILNLCKAEEILYGIILSFFYSLGKTIYNIRQFKKDYIDINDKND